MYVVTYSGRAAAAASIKRRSSSRSLIGRVSRGCLEGCRLSMQRTYWRDADVSHKFP